MSSGDPSGPGSRAPHEAAGASSPKASIPIADTDDTIRNGTFRFRSEITSRGTEVSLGYSRDGECAALKFTNNCGTVTKFGLSLEGLDALRALMAIPMSQFNVPPVETEWRIVVDGLVEQGAAMVAQAIEARRAETGTGSVHESAVAESDAPEPISPEAQRAVLHEWQRDHPAPDPTFPQGKD